MQERNRRPSPYSLGRCHGNGRGATEGVEKGHNYRERPGPNWGSCPFHVCRMQLPSLSFVNEATDCSF